MRVWRKRKRPQLFPMGNMWITLRYRDGMVDLRLRDSDGQVVYEASAERSRVVPEPE